MSHPIESIMETALKNLKEMVDVETIVGDAVEAPNGTVIIPISKVSFGFAAGGSEFGKKDESNQAKFGGGSGGGVSISPVAFMVVGENQIKLLPVSSASTSVDRIIDAVPGMIEKINNKICKIKADKKAKEEPGNVKEA